jgi:sugar O-acyltransferase (sialic acid O-acetyltransferase NeuD family)
MRSIVIYGAGGFGRETAFMIREINRLQPEWNLLGFCDDGKRKNDIVDGYPVLGGLNTLNAFAEPVAVALAVADPQGRKKLRSAIVNGNITFPTLIHPSVLRGDIERNSLAEGAIVCAGTIMTTNVHIKSFAIINLMCSIGHDVTIGEYCSLMPSCSISGFVTLEEEVLIGTGARILPLLTVGKASRVGAGAVVVEHVKPGITVVGIPAK